MATTHFSDWTKMFGDFKSPTMDFNRMITLMKSNAETGTAVIQILTENAQTSARRLTEIARSNTELAMKASKEAFNNSSPESAATKHADFTKNWLEFNVNSMRELAENSTKSTQEAFEVISKRVAEQVKEFSDSATTTHSKKKAA